MLKQVSDIVKPIFIRLSHCCNMSWKWAFSSERWGFGSLLSGSLILDSWSSASSRYRVLLDVASSLTTLHMSSAVGKPFTLFLSQVKVVDIRICLARYSLFSNSSILTSFNSIWSSVAGVFLSFSIGIPLLTANSMDAVAVPLTCLQRPFSVTWVDSQLNCFHYHRA